MATLANVAIRAAAVALAVFGAAPASAEPKGNLNIAMATFGEQTFLPWLGSTSRKFYIDAISEYLIHADPATLEARPGLAARWEMSKDGKTFTFWLRQGVQFHEGWGEMTAEDAKFSIERLMDTKSLAGQAGILRAAIAAIDTPEKYKLVVTLKEPNGDFAIDMLSNAVMVAIVSKKYVTEKGDEAANARPIGTGAYMLAEFKKGATIKLKLAPDAAKHWRVKPGFETITFLNVPEEATRVAKLKTGEADMAPIGYDAIDSIKGSGLRIVSIKNTWSPVIRMGGLNKFQNSGTPWHKKEVRQALNYAIDKNAIAKGIFRGEAVAAGMHAPSDAYKHVPPYPYDPQKAKQLLAAAGYPNGFEVTIRAFRLNPGAELPVLAETVALYWQAIGVRTRIVPVDWGTMRGAWANGKATDYLWTHRGYAVLSPAFPFHQANLQSSLFSAYATPETDRMIVEISAELDADKRMALIKKMATYIHEEASDIFLVWANELYGASKKVGAWPALPGNITNMDMITRGE